MDCSVIFLVVITICLTSAKVIELDERLNDEKLYKHGGSWIVMFYAPWCAYCEKMKPAWDEVGKNYAGSKVHVARVDLTKYPAVGEHHKVEGMPTIKMFHDGNVYDYEGKREYVAISTFIGRVTNPPVSFIDDLPSLKAVEKAQNAFFVLSYSTGRSSQLKSRYVKAASKLRLEGNFYESTSKAIHEKLGITTTPSLAVFRDGQSMVYDSKNISQAALEEWLGAERFTLCPHLDDHGIYDYINTKRPVVFTVIERIRSSTEQKLADHVRFIAYGLKYKSDFYFATTDQLALVRRMLLRFISKPSLIVWDFDTKVFWTFPKSNFDEVTQSDVEDFLESIKNGDISPSGGEDFFRRLYRMFWLIGEMVMDVYETTPWVVVSCGGVLVAALFFCCVVMFSTDPEKVDAHASKLFERDQLRRETPSGFYTEEKEHGGYVDDSDDEEEEHAEGEDVEEDDDAKAARAQGKLKQS